MDCLGYIGFLCQKGVSSCKESLPSCKICSIIVVSIVWVLLSILPAYFTADAHGGNVVQGSIIYVLIYGVSPLVFIGWLSFSIYFMGPAVIMCCSGIRDSYSGYYNGRFQGDGRNVVNSSDV